ncbi:MAG: HEAT repeat domain-containing protein [Planctomycetales bacterium]
MKSRMLIGGVLACVLTGCGKSATPPEQAAPPQSQGEPTAQQSSARQEVAPQEGAPAAARSAIPSATAPPASATAEAKPQPPGAPDPAPATTRKPGWGAFLDALRGTVPETPAVPVPVESFEPGDPITEKSASAPRPGAPGDEPQPIDPKLESWFDNAGTDAVPRLIEYLKDPNPAVRAKAVQQLGYMSWRSQNDGAVLPALVESLDSDRNPEVRTWAARAVGGFAARHEVFGDEEKPRDVSRPVAALAKALSDESPEVRATAADSLASVGKPADSAAPALIRALDDEHAEVAARAARALGELSPEAAKSAVPRLDTMLTKGQSNQKAAAAYALGKIGEPARSSVPALSKLLQASGAGRPGFYDPYEGVRHEAAVALGRLGAVAELEAAWGPTGRGRAAVIAGLGEVRPSTAKVVELLSKGARDENEDVRQGVARALGNLDPKIDAAVPLLTQLLKDENEYVRASASGALGGFESNVEAQVAALLVAGTDKEDYVRMNARNSLRNLAKKAAPTLIEFIRDSQNDEQRRVIALEALRWPDEEIRDSVRALALERLRDEQESPTLRGRAAIALRWIDDEAEPKLVVAALTDALRKSQSSELRSEAASTLADLEAVEAVPVLIETLAEKDETVRNAAASALGEFGDDAAPAVPALCKLLQDTRLVNRGAAAAALGNIGQPALEQGLPLLLAGLDDEDDDVRQSCIGALGELNEAVTEADQRGQVVAGLIGALAEKEMWARTRAAGSVARYKADAAPAVPVLARMMDSEEDYEASAAVEALGEIGRPAAALVPRIAKLAAGEKQSLRDSAVGALGRIAANPEVAVPAIVAAMDYPDSRFATVTALEAFIEHAQPAVPKLIEMCRAAEGYERSQAVSLLEKIGPNAKQAAPALAKIVREDQSYLGDAALSALMRVAPDEPVTHQAVAAKLGQEDRYSIVQMLLERPEAAAPILAAALSSKDSAVRQGGLEVVRRIENPLAVAPALAAALADEDRGVRQYAAMALARSRPYRKQVLPVLIESLHEVSEEREYEIQSALRQMGPAAVPRLVDAFVSAKSPAHRRNLADVLADRHDLEGHRFPALEDALAAPDAALRLDAAVVLASAGFESDAVVAALVAGLDLPDAEGRARAAEALGEMGVKARPHAPRLVKALRDDSEEVRDAAGSALMYRELVDASMLPELLAALRDERTGFYAVHVLGQLEAEAAPAIPALIELLESDDEDLRDSASNVLPRIGAPALPPLVALLGTADATPTARQAAASAILRMRDRHAEDGAEPVRLDSAYPALAARLADPNETLATRVLAAAILADSDEHRARSLPVLADGIRSDDYEVIYAARGALVAHKEEAASLVPELKKRFLSGELDGGEAVAEILGELMKPDEAAALFVEAMVADKDGEVREDLEYALGRLGLPAAPKLVELLQSKNPDLRLATVRLLRDLRYGDEYDDYDETERQLPPEALAALEKALADADLRVRRHAAIALAEADPESAKPLPVLIETIADTDAYGDAAPIDEALYAIGRLGDKAREAVPAIVKLLAAPTYGRDGQYRRYAAANALGSIGPAARPAAPALVALLRSGEAASAAASALGEIGADAPEAVAALIAALDDSQAFHSAIEALAKLGPAGEPAVRKLLAELDDEFARHDAAAALGAFEAHAERVVPVLAARLRDPDVEMRRRAAAALGRLGTKAKSALPDLIALLEDEQIREAAATALGGLGAEAAPAVPALAKLLEIDELDCRRAAAAALGAIGPPAGPAVPALLRLLQEDQGKEDDGYWRYAAIAALSKMGEHSQAAVPYLTATLDDPDMRYSAVDALGEIGQAARPAVPKLLELARGAKDEYQRRHLRKALMAIDPETAAQAPE